MAHMRWFGCLLVLGLFWGCTKMAVKPIADETATPNNPPVILPKDSVTYLALGGSYTYGAGVPLAESYPYQLVASLAAEGYYTNAPRVVAFQGWTAADLLKGIQSAHISSKFNIVTLLIGVNDEAQGTEMAAYTAQFDQLLTLAIAYAHGYAGRVFVVAIPDWSVTPFAAGMDKTAIKAGVMAFNRINEAESKKFGANYVDITALSETVAVDPSLTSGDGLHPSGKLYGLWARQLAPVVTGTFDNGHL